MILWEMERAKFRLECEKITASKVIDNLFSSVFTIICLISPRFHKYTLLRLISVTLAKFAGLVCPLFLFASVVVVPVRNLRAIVKKNSQLRSLSIRQYEPVCFSVSIQVYLRFQLQCKIGKIKSWHSQSCFIKLCLATVALSPAINLFLYFRYLSIEID